MVFWTLRTVGRPGPRCVASADACVGTGPVETSSGVSPDADPGGVPDRPAVLEDLIESPDDRRSLFDPAQESSEVGGIQLEAR